MGMVWFMIPASLVICTVLLKDVYKRQALLLAAAYAPPAFGFALPAVVPMVIFLAWIPLGMASITRLTTFRDYYAINKELLAGLDVYKRQVFPQCGASGRSGVGSGDTRNAP